MMKSFKLNWRPDAPDHRDFKYLAHPEAVGPTPELPKSVDLRGVCMSPVKDQGQAGSCTGQGWSSVFESLQLIELKKKLSGDSALEEFNKTKFTPASALFIYWNERILDGTTTQDSGSEIRTGMKAVKQFGVCPESLWPYDIAREFSTPTTHAYNIAKLHKVLYGYKIDNTKLTLLKTCLNQGYPIVYGQTLYNSFMSDAVANTGVVPMPGQKESPVGGHCTVIAGYDDATSRFIVKNSWGTSWGDKGYFYMPYEYLTNPDLASDFWTARPSQE